MLSLGEALVRHTVARPHHSLVSFRTDCFTHWLVRMTLELAAVCSKHIGVSHSVCQRCIDMFNITGWSRTPTLSSVFALSI